MSVSITPGAPLTRMPRGPSAAAAFDQRVDGAWLVLLPMADRSAGAKRGHEHATALMRSQQLLQQEIGRPHVDGKQLVEILDRDGL
jgi:hypothetical protein